MCLPQVELARRRTPKNHHHHHNYSPYLCSSNAYEEAHYYFLCPQHKESNSKLQWHTERPTIETAVSTSSSTKTAYPSPSSASSKSYKTPTGTVCSKLHKRASNYYKSHLRMAPTSITSPHLSPRGGIHRTACRAGLRAIRWNRVELRRLTWRRADMGLMTGNRHDETRSTMLVRKQKGKKKDGKGHSNQVERIQEEAHWLH